MSQEPKDQPHFGSGVIQIVCLTWCEISSSASALGSLPLLRPSPRITSVVRWLSDGRYSFLNWSAALPKSLFTSASRTRPEKTWSTALSMLLSSKNCVTSATSATNTKVLTFENRPPLPHPPSRQHRL